MLTVEQRIELLKNLPPEKAIAFHRLARLIEYRADLLLGRADQNRINSVTNVIRRLLNTISG